MTRGAGSTAPTLRSQQPPRGDQDGSVLEGPAGGVLRAGPRWPLRGNGRWPLLHNDFAITEENGARAPLPLAEPSAEIREVRVRIHHVSLDGLHTRLVIPTVVERDPKTLELRGSTDLRPSDPIRHMCVIPSSRRGPLFGTPSGGEGVLQRLNAPI
jgi:hypothetical protein